MKKIVSFIALCSSVFATSLDQLPKTPVIKEGPGFRLEFKTGQSRQESPTMVDIISVTMENTGRYEYIALVDYIMPRLNLCFRSRKTGIAKCFDIWNLLTDAWNKTRNSTRLTSFPYYKSTTTHRVATFTTPTGVVVDIYGHTPTAGRYMLFAKLNIDPNNEQGIKVLTKVSPVTQDSTVCFYGHSWAIYQHQDPTFNMLKRELTIDTSKLPPLMRDLFRQYMQKEIAEYRAKLSPLIVIGPRPCYIPF